MLIIGQGICPLTRGAGGIVEIDKDSLSGNPTFNNEVTKVGSHLFQSNEPGIHPLHSGRDSIQLGRDKGLIAPYLLNLILNKLHLRSGSDFQSRVRMVQFSLKGDNVNTC